MVRGSVGRMATDCPWETLALEQYTLVKLMSDILDRRHPRFLFVNGVASYLLRFRHVSFYYEQQGESIGYSTW